MQGHVRIAVTGPPSRRWQLASRILLSLETGAHAAGEWEVSKQFRNHMRKHIQSWVTGDGAGEAGYDTRTLTHDVATAMGVQEHNITLMQHSNMRITAESLKHICWVTTQPG